MLREPRYVLLETKKKPTFEGRRLLPARETPALFTEETFVMGKIVDKLIAVEMRAGKTKSHAIASLKRRGLIRQSGKHLVLMGKKTPEKKS